MTRPLEVEIKILLLITGFGIYFFASTELANYIISKKPKKLIRKALIEITTLIIQTYITYEFCYRLASGYIPIYFILFLVLGILLYYLLMKEYTMHIYIKIDTLLTKFKPIIKSLFYSHHIFQIIRRFMIYLLNPFKKISDMIKSVKKKKNQEEKEKTSELDSKK